MMFFQRKVFTPFIALLLCLLFAASAFLITFFCMRPIKNSDPADLYAAAVADAIVAEEGEIFPLVSLTKDSDMVTWHEDGERVLLLSWNRSPGEYAAGKQVDLDELWTFTDKEIQVWYEENGDGVDDWGLRLKQLIGLPPASAYTHISAFWVNVTDVIRPAYQTDATKPLEAESLNGDMLGAHKDWFDGNIVYSYFTSAYPWTRLGYTYDWAEGSGEYGLTEFLVSATAAEVAFTMTTEEFIRSMEKSR